MRMTEPEISYFKSLLPSVRSYLEYGSGGSTLLAAEQPGITRILSVESDPGYIRENVEPSPSVADAVREGRLEFILVDIGQTKAWGYPKDRSKRYLWPNYAFSPYRHGHVADLILIDGRFRIACALAAALESPAARVLVHDYSIRKEYRVLERFFDVVHVVETLVELRVKDGFDRKEAAGLLGKYVYEPGDDSVAFLDKRKRSLGRLRKRLIRKVSGRRKS